MYAGVGAARPSASLVAPLRWPRLFTPKPGRPPETARSPASLASRCPPSSEIGAPVSFSQPSSVGTPHQAESAGSPRRFLPKAVFGGGGGSVAAGGVGASGGGSFAAALRKPAHRSTVAPSPACESAMSESACA
jgi:hypothetical protein